MKKNQVRYMQQYEAWEEKKLWRILNTIVYEEGMNMVQRNPISFDAAET